MSTPTPLWETVDLQLWSEPGWAEIKATSERMAKEKRMKAPIRYVSLGMPRPPLLPAMLARPVPRPPTLLAMLVWHGLMWIGIVHVAFFLIRAVVWALGGGQ